MGKLLNLCVVISGLAVTTVPAFARSTNKPAYFALPTTAFPAPSTLIGSHVEPNRRVTADNILHFGASFVHEGRMTGYFMEAVEGRRTLPRSDTSYLVSLFPTAQQAANAFAQQYHYWDALAAHGDAASVPLSDDAYGDAGQEAFYTVRLPTGAILAELLFRRGTIFIEVFQEVYGPHPSHAEVRAFFDIGTRLDIIARGIRNTPCAE